MVHFHGKADMSFLVTLIFLMLDGSLMCSSCLVGIVGSIAVNVAGVSVLLQQFIGKQRGLLKTIYDVSNIDYSMMLQSINQVSEDLSNHNGFIGSQAHTSEFFAALQLATERVLFENADTDSSECINNDSEEVDYTDDEEEEVEDTTKRDDDSVRTSDSGEDSSSSDENITCRVSSSSVEEEEQEMTEEEKAERLRMIESITNNSETEAKVRSIDESESSSSSHESISSSSSSPLPVTKNEVNDLPFLKEMTVVY